jgi:iron-sulfur cluster assembly protein
VVAVTPNAAKAFTRFCNEAGCAGTCYLRVRVVPGGCSGFLHKLDLDSAASPTTDHVFESAGIRVVVMKRQVEMLRGTQVDYGEKSGKQGFEVTVAPNFQGESLRKWLPILTADAPELAALDRSDLPERISNLRQAARVDPQNELVQYHLGKRLVVDGQYLEAAKSFERAIHLDPHFWNAHLWLGHCFIKLDQKDRAVEVLRTGWKVADKAEEWFGREAFAKLLTDLGVETPPK